MSPSPQSDLRRRLRDLLVASRRQKGLNQGEVARKLGKPQSYVSKYETGERRLDVIEFIEIAEAIGVQPLALIRRMLSAAAKE